MAATRAPLELHRRLPGYAVTAVVDAPGVATSLGVGRVLVKVESNRFGLPAFKMLGASWATYRAVVERLGSEPQWSTLDELRAAVEPLRPLTLAAATDGNHGRAVAAMARLLGFEARVFVPSDMVAARIAGIESEGATVEIVDGSYDDAVSRSAKEAGARCLVISDTSWEGYTEPPKHVIEGYSTIFFEIEDAGRVRTRRRDGARRCRRVGRGDVRVLPATRKRLGQRQSCRWNPTTPTVSCSRASRVS